MSDVINVMQKVDSVDISPLFNTYSKVVINIDDETQASTGNDSGRTLELTNPLFGSQTVATKVLERLRGYQYQPYKAVGAILDPAAEIGDAISANDVYGGIYTRDRLFGRLMKATVSAPHDEEINHEYTYETPVERKLKREMGNVKAEFSIQATQIAAKVSQVGGTNSSFGWTLTDSAHTWYAGNTAVMKVNSSGLEVYGKVTATSGYIGNSSSGFEITATAIRNGMTSLNDTTHNGIYVGTGGIALGKGAFKVTSAGDVTARRLTVETLYINGTAVSAATLNSRANSAYTSTSAGGYCYGGAGGGYSWNQAKVGNETASYFRTNTLVVNNSVTLMGSGVGKYTAVINGVTIPYFGWGAPY